MSSSLTVFVHKYTASILLLGFFLADRSHKIQRQLMHIVPTSPWPFLSAVIVLFFLVTVVSFFRYVSLGSYFVFLCIALLLSIQLL